MNDTLTPEEIGIMRALRDRGFAVCVFEPSELRDAPPDEVEDRMCEAGWAAIEHFNEDQTT